jgi:hypothetical protein
MKDPIVDEIRATRAKIAEECGYDLQRILDHARDAANQLPGLKYISREELQAKQNRQTKTHNAQTPHQ